MCLLTAAIVQLAPVEMEQLSENSKPLFPKFAASSCSFAMSVLSLHNALFNNNNDNPWHNAATTKAGASNLDVLRSGDTHAEIRFANRNTPPKIIATDINKIRLCCNEIITYTDSNYKLTCRECSSRLPGTININARRVSMTCFKDNTTTNRRRDSPKLITPNSKTNFNWFSEIA